jgi:Fe-coproporphyrin III synthase
MNGPTYAIVAITLNCNSRCIMCDIWKNKIKNELEPDAYLKLPQTLRDINITGGEPFLRRDIVQIVANMRKAAPYARFVLNSNGFMPHKIGPDMKEILKIDPKFAFRVSIDGMGDKHDEIRRIPGGFDKIMKSLEIVRSLGAKDVGISFTLGNYNMDELPKVQAFAAREKLEFSLTVTTGSSIYFGKDKASYRPTDVSKLTPLLQDAAQKHMESYTPKGVVRAWFVRRMLEYLVSGKRNLPCDAGTGFFYMDSVGNVYTCHMKPWIMGNISTDPFEKIFANRHFDAAVSACNDCWMVCTVKTMIQKNFSKVAYDVVLDTVRESVLRRYHA